MNGNRFVVEVWGEETIHHKRLLIVEAPEGTTEKEIEALSLDVFEQVSEPPPWELEESCGIWPCKEYHPEVIGAAPDCDPTDAQLVRNEEGELVVVQK